MHIGKQLNFNKVAKMFIKLRNIVLYQCIYNINRFDFNNRFV